MDPCHPKLVYWPQCVSRDVAHRACTFEISSFSHQNAFKLFSPETFEVQDNRLTGSVPVQFANLSSLSKFFLFSF